MAYTLVGRIEIFAAIASQNTETSLLKFLQKETGRLCDKEGFDQDSILFGKPNGVVGDGKIGSSFPEETVGLSSLEESVKAYLAGPKDASYLLGLYLQA